MYVIWGGMKWGGVEGGKGKMQRGGSGGKCYFVNMYIRIFEGG